MNVFVLGTGRCGTLTWATACQQITNYTSAHESRCRNWKTRFGYPPNHIEVDHRLALFLGTVDRLWGNEAAYVHLTREPEAVAESWSVRLGESGMMRNWPRAVFYRPKGLSHLDAARIMVRTVNDEIGLFLKDKTKVVRATIEDPHDPFDEFWDLIGADGDRAEAHRQLDVHHNARSR